jgi:hypothetical protein
VTSLQPALTAAAGAGFNLLCTWHSLSPSFVTYGQASTDEICLFGPSSPALERRICRE